ncbi:MAG: GntR family transcriptional regulator [Planctomycetes bacterium]|nr:GntR family transcriptional regulator [Planctomycetota bacterium]
MKTQSLERRKPKHERILEAIRQEIESGVLPHGAALASEAQLCEKLKASRGPIRQALAELQRRGLVKARPGKGSFVHNPVAVAPKAAVKQLLVLVNSVGATPSNFVAHELIDGLSRAVEEAGEKYRLSFQFHRNPSIIEPDSIQGCHGVVMAPFTHDGIRAMRELAERLTVPVVSVYNRLDATGASQFYVDHEAGAFDATDLLFRYGHRRIAMLGEPAISPGPAATEREAGFLRAAKSAGLNEDEARIVRVGVDPMVARGNIERLLRQADRPTALVVAGGVITPIALDAIRAAGLSVPRDLSIIAVDDTVEAAMNVPRLTVVKIPLIHLSRLGISSLIAQTGVGSATQGPVSLGLKPEIVMAQSIAPVVQRA